jgi:hypothetical protein
MNTGTMTAASTSAAPRWPFLAIQSVGSKWTSMALAAQWTTSDIE